jgi:dihydroorotase
MEILIKNARIVSELYDLDTLRDVYISDGIIKEIGTNLSHDCEVIDAHSNLLMPGLIDVSCKICESGYENKDNIIKVSASAAAGGFTTLTSSPKTLPILDNKSVVEYVYGKAAADSVINVYLFGSMTKGCEGNEIAEMGEMIEKGVIAIADGGTSVSNAETLRNIMLYIKMFDVPLITSCMDKDLACDGMVNSGYISTKLGLRGNPVEAEEIVVARNLILAQHLSCKMHLISVTASGSVHLIRDAKRNADFITAGTCPHYFTLTEAEVENYNTLAKIYPPLRTEEDVQRIVDGIKDGTIDVISSGHMPAPWDRKNAEFERAAYGISSLETALPVSYTRLVKGGVITVNELVDKMAKNPARILGLRTKGIIKEGMDADLIIVDVDNKYMVDSAEFASKAKYSLYDGQELYGKPLVTICGGKVVMRKKFN